MIVITDEFIEKNIEYSDLINAMILAFGENSIECPAKTVHDYSGGKGIEKNTLLCMPAWDNQKYMGVKLITTTPHNNRVGLPYINGIYLLFNADNGLPLVTMDAKLITNIRTAATSVLASSFLAKKDATSVLILGNGNLSPFYIAAYAVLPGIKNIYLWGRNMSKSQSVVEQMDLPDHIEVKAVSTYKDLVSSVDIVSCITSSSVPLVVLDDVSKGQHFDLAGGYNETMLEVDTDVVEAASVFTDNYDATLDHAGELVKAFEEGKLTRDDIKGDLKYLCSDNTEKRKSQYEITLFKSTGMAVEDLVIAQLIFTKYEAERK